jgi:hypothetical protein
MSAPCGANRVVDMPFRIVFLGETPSEAENGISRYNVFGAEIELLSGRSGAVTEQEDNCVQRREEEKGCKAEKGMKRRERGELTQGCRSILKVVYRAGISYAPYSVLCCRTLAAGAETRYPHTV